MYKDALKEYKEAKAHTAELNSKLHERNEMYITREETYNVVIDELVHKKKDNSLQTLAVISEKMNDEDELILNGIDIHDKE